MTFWHITDTHADWLYKIKSSPEDGYCRNGSGIAGEFGDYLCYGPLTVLESEIQQMHSIDSLPQFILHGGDAFPNDNGIQEEVLEQIGTSIDLLQKYFPGIPVIYTLGNHDCYPVHCVTPNCQWLTQIADLLKSKGILSDDQYKTFQKGGYYTSKVGGLTLLVVNTNFYLSLNSCTKGMSGDLADQFNFIQSQLAQSKSNNERVLVHGHVPPGFSEQDAGLQFQNKAWNDNYLKSFEGYGSIILGHVYGHEHTDTFRLTTNNGVMFVAPTACTYRHNPGFRRYNYSSDGSSNYYLNGYEQYWMNLLLSNKNSQINWLLEYSTKDQPYYLSDLSLASLTQLAHKFSIDNDLFFHYTVFNGAWIDPLPCTGTCKVKQMCGIQYPYYDVHEQCITNGTQEQFVTY